MGYPDGSAVKDLPLTHRLQEICSVSGLGKSLGGELTIHSSILILWIEESGGIQPIGSQRVRYD